MENNSGNSILMGKDFIETVNGVSFKMVHVQGGTFTMGATSEQGSEYDGDERPVHSVTLTKDYYIGECEVTQGLWKAVMGSNPSYFKNGDNYPVENVSWNDIQTFLTKLNQMTGKTYALPTEAQWEYAARGGVKSKGYKYSGSNTIGDVAWYRADNDGTVATDYTGTTHPVGTKKANELGLYDMSGNVWEWCQDWYDDYSSGSQTDLTDPSSGSGRVLRGGCWYGGAWLCRVSNWCYGYPDDRRNYSGFRLVLVPDHELCRSQSMPNDTRDVSVRAAEKALLGRDGKDFFEMVNGVLFKMVYVKAGTFTMGATSEQGDDAGDSEKPAHEVTLTEDYYIGECVVTQGLWQAVMGTTIYRQRDKANTSWPIKGVGFNYPMYYVSWNEAQEFCAKLSRLTGRTYALPTEAQWEYAARGGRKSAGYKYSGSNYIDNVAWYDEDLNTGSTHPVKQKSPNELGLYDMSGNVWEWCQDWLGSGRVLRGGSWYSVASYCRVSNRSNYTPGNRYSSDGFRVVLLP